MIPESSRPAVPPHLTAAGREPHDNQLRGVLGSSGSGWDVPRPAPPPRSREELDAVMDLHGYDDGWCAAGCRYPCGCKMQKGTCPPYQAAFHALQHLNTPA